MIKSLDDCYAFHVGGDSLTLLHSGWEANFENSCRSGSCPKSEWEEAGLEKLHKN